MLNEKQSLAFDTIREGKNTFISGSGGKGKSHLIRDVVDKMPESSILVAPTGIAALNIGGATIHSAFKFPTSILTKKHYSRFSQKTEELFDKKGPVKRIIIDEISMVRQDVLTVMDQQLRRIRKLNIPFGGLQVVGVGDFFQLPSVITNNENGAYYSQYDSPFCFAGETWAQANFNYIELEENMRQSDDIFRMHLERIRRKSEGYLESVDFFNDVGFANTQEILDSDPVFICSTNRSADTINISNYKDLDGEEKTYKAAITGKFDARPSPELLNLKYGTKVIFTANTESFRNGETGYAIGFGNDYVEVIKEETEETVIVKRNRWEDREYTIKSDGSLGSFPTGSYEQFPLRHGWAVTIHKCQGMSLANAMIDLGLGAFCSGQTYVALSRLRTLQGLGLISKIRHSDIIVDKKVIEFYNNGCRGIGLGF